MRSCAVFSDALRNYFAKFGAVADAVVMKDSASKRSRGFGFITFESAHSVDLVLVSDVHIIDNRRVSRVLVCCPEFERTLNLVFGSAVPNISSGGAGGGEEGRAEVRGE